MSRTRKRRQRRQATHLLSKADVGQRALCLEWNKKLQSWVAEIQRRKACLKIGVPMREVDQIFEVLKHAERLLMSCGARIERAVGVETRSVLRAECSKAVAQVYGPGMYRLIQHGWYNEHLRELTKHRRNIVRPSQQSLNRTKRTQS